MGFLQNIPIFSYKILKFILSYVDLSIIVVLFFNHLNALNTNVYNPASSLKWSNPTTL